jgi:hypothetical protein
VRDGTSGDDREEARDGDDEVAELGVLVGPEPPEQRRGGVEQRPSEEVGRGREQAAAPREPGLVGGGATTGERGEEREEVAGVEAEIRARTGTWG